MHISCLAAHQMLQGHVAQRKEEAGQRGHAVQRARHLATGGQRALLRRRRRHAPLAALLLGSIRGVAAVGLHGLTALLHLVALLGASGGALALLHAGLLAGGGALALGRRRKGGARQVAQDGCAQVLGRGVQRIQRSQGRLCGAVPGSLGQGGGNHHRGQGGIHTLRHAVVYAAGVGNVCACEGRGDGLGGSAHMPLQLLL